MGLIQPSSAWLVGLGLLHVAAFAGRHVPYRSWTLTAAGVVQTENRSPTLLQPWRAVATKRLARRRGNRGVITKSVELIFADGSVNDLLLAKGGAAFDQGLALVRHNTASAAVLDLGFDCPETTREVFDRIR